MINFPTSTIILCIILTLVAVVTCSEGPESKLRWTVRRKGLNRFDDDNCRDSGFFADENDCSIFYRCFWSNGPLYILVQLRCPASTIFDPTYSACTDPALINGPMTHCITDPFIPSPIPDNSTPEWIGDDTSVGSTTSSEMAITSTTEEPSATTYNSIEVEVINGETSTTLDDSENPPVLCSNDGSSTTTASSSENLPSQDQSTTSTIGVIPPEESNNELPPPEIGGDAAIYSTTTSKDESSSTTPLPTPSEEGPVPSPTIETSSPDPITTTSTTQTPPSSTSSEEVDSLSPSSIETSSPEATTSSTPSNPSTSQSPSSEEVSISSSTTPSSPTTSSTTQAPSITIPSGLVVHPGSMFKCPGTGLFPHPFSCVRFFRCFEIQPNLLFGFLYRCPDYYGFSSDTSRCEKLIDLPTCNASFRLGFIQLPFPSLRTRNKIPSRLQIGNAYSNYYANHYFQ